MCSAHCTNYTDFEEKNTFLSKKNSTQSELTFNLSMCIADTIPQLVCNGLHWTGSAISSDFQPLKYIFCNQSNALKLRQRHSRKAFNQSEAKNNWYSRINLQPKICPMGIAHDQDDDDGGGEWDKTQYRVVLV